jgi:hypothetical protein
LQILEGRSGLSCEAPIKAQQKAPFTFRFSSSSDIGQCACKVGAVVCGNSHDAQQRLKGEFEHVTLVVRVRSGGSDGALVFDGDCDDRRMYLCVRSSDCFG